MPNASCYRNRSAYFVTYHRNRSAYVIVCQILYGQTSFEWFVSFAKLPFESRKRKIVSKAEDHLDHPVLTTILQKRLAGSK